MTSKRQRVPRVTDTTEMRYRVRAVLKDARWEVEEAERQNERCREWDLKHAGEYMKKRKEGGYMEDDTALGDVYYEAHQATIRMARAAIDKVENKVRNTKNARGIEHQANVALALARSVSMSATTAMVIREMEWEDEDV